MIPQLPEKCQANLNLCDYRVRILGFPFSRRICPNRLKIERNPARSGMNHVRTFTAAIFHLAVLSVTTMAGTIHPLNPNASVDARKLLTYLCDLPRQSENRLISGHRAGRSIGPAVPKDQERQEGGHRFTMNEIEYLHKVSGQWVGLIGADYCAGWITCSDPIEATMYYKEVNRGLMEYWNAGGLVIIKRINSIPESCIRAAEVLFRRTCPRASSSTSGSILKNTRILT
jgi:hypothetical protein